MGGSETRDIQVRTVTSGWPKFRQSDWACCLLPVGMGLLGFWRLPQAFFMYDDFTWLILAQQWTQADLPLWYNPWRVFTPMTHLAYWGNYVLWGSDATGYYIFNLLLHSLVVVLVYFLARLLDLSHLASLLGSTLFAVAFAHWEAVVWITGVIRLLLALFVLLSLVTLILFLHSGKRWLYGFSLITFILALFSKEWAVELMGVTVLMVWLYRRRQLPVRSNLLAMAKLLTPYALITVLFLLFLAWYWRLDAGLFPYESTGFFRPGIHLLSNIYTALGALCVPSPLWDPVRNRLSQLRPELLSVLSIATGIAVLCMSIVIATTLALGSRRAKVLALWLIGGVTLVSASTLGLPPRYLYIPSIPFSLLVALGVDWTWSRLSSARSRHWTRVVLLVAFSIIIVLNMAGNWLTSSFMVSNGQVRKALAVQVHEQVVTRPQTEILVVGLPGKYEDVFLLGDRFSADGNFARLPVRFVSSLPSNVDSDTTIWIFDGQQLQERSAP